MDDARVDPGRMARDIAHEIGTPIQFVGDSLHFLQDALEDLVAVTRLAREGASPAQLEQRSRELDLDFIEQEIPRAFARCRRGCEQVTDLVRALRDLAGDDRDGDRGRA